MAAASTAAPPSHDFHATTQARLFCSLATIMVATSGSEKLKLEILGCHVVTDAPAYRSLLSKGMLRPDRYWTYDIAALLKSPQFADGVGRAIVSLVTLPYYRFFHFNTLGIMRRVAWYKNRPHETKALLHVVGRWRERKIAELQFISIASAVLAGAVIGSLSWYNISAVYWPALACWYCSLVLSILGILLASQQIAVLNFLGHIPAEADTKFATTTLDKYIPLLLVQQNPGTAVRLGERGNGLWHSTQWAPRQIMVFVWQCPIMFMSYSVCLFLLGLTLAVATPLIRLREQGWSTDANIAVFYLVTVGAAGALFVLSSFWVYHFVDINADEVDQGGATPTTS